MWKVLTQFHSRASVEFLPVYRPDAAERRDPALFAAKVRDVMAASLGADTTDASFEDARIVWAGKGQFECEFQREKDVF